MKENKGNVDQLLLDAALNGDVTILTDLVGKDTHLLRRPSKIQPLHISSKFGHLEFTAELLRRNPNLAKELDPTDKSSPLHLASGNGHVHVVTALAKNNPCMCVARDAHGMNPAHVAAIKGHVLVLEELIGVVPSVTKERVGGGGRESILHLCVKYNQLAALKKVVEMAPPGDSGMLLNAKDGDGNTILHLAMADQRVEIIEFLLKDVRVEKDKQNEYGWTAMDIFHENDKNDRTKNTKMSDTLNQAKAKLLLSKEIDKKEEKEKRTSWFHEQRNALMIVASLVATMAFQAGLTPPFTDENDKEFHVGSYKQFAIANTIGMVTSMSSIILLISGLPGRRFFMVIVMLMMWMAVSCMTFTYAVLLGFKTSQLIKLSNDLNNSYLNAIKHFRRGIIVWAFGMALILLWHLTSWTVKLFNKFYVWLTDLEWPGKLFKRFKDWLTGLGWLVSCDGVKVGPDGAVAPDMVFKANV